MTAPRFQIPIPLRNALSLLPAYPGSVLFVLGLNFILAKHLPADVLRNLERRSLRIVVDDAGIQFDFHWCGAGFQATRHMGDVDLIIRASLHDFCLLATRKEDPDTLFFSRRLVLEGDTELGLMVKNALDAIDLSALMPDFKSPGVLLQYLRTKGFPVQGKSSG